MTDNTISPPIREHGEGVREKLHKALDDDMGHLTDAQSLSGPYALRRVKETIDRALSAQPVNGEDDEAKRDAWGDFEGIHLTDGNDGYAPAATYRACRAAFDAAWPLGAVAARGAACDALPPVAQPVKDAVRGDGALIRGYFVCPSCMCRGFARVQTADLQDTDDVRCIECKRVYPPPLSPKSPASVGLDPAKALRAALPEKIGRLSLGQKLSEEHYCGGSHDMPDGQPIYWQERGGEYPDDIDGYCLTCAIEQAESDSGWCECSITAALTLEDRS